MGDLVRFKIGDFAYQTLDIGEKSIIRKVQIAGLIFHSPTKVGYVLAGAQDRDYDGHDIFADQDTAIQAALIRMAQVQENK